MGGTMTGGAGRASMRVIVSACIGSALEWCDFFLHGTSVPGATGRPATLTFLCELGPPPYAITGPGGAELSDRWSEAASMQDMIRDLWRRIEIEGAA